MWERIGKEREREREREQEREKRREGGGENRILFCLRDIANHLSYQGIALLIAL